MSYHNKAGGHPGYETTIITRSELSDDVVKTLVDRIGGIVQDFGGQVVLTEDWGRRKLAYTIQKEQRGHYNYLVYSGRPGVVAEIERNLRINESVLRFMTVNLDKEFDGEIFRARRAEIHAAAKRRELEREARREERNAERRYRDRDDNRYESREEAIVESEGDEE